jgi:hypothetical protein
MNWSLKHATLKLTGYTSTRYPFLYMVTEQAGLLSIPSSPLGPRHCDFPIGVLGSVFPGASLYPSLLPHYQASI